MDNTVSTILVILTYIGSIVLVPWLIIQLPADYFAHEDRETCMWKGDSLHIKRILLILKNIVGGILVLVGIAMLFLPGQGILTIVAGLLLMNFPYKYQVEKWIMGRPVVLKTFNAVRIKFNKEPFLLVLPDDDEHHFP